MIGSRAVSAAIGQGGATLGPLLDVALRSRLIAGDGSIKFSNAWGTTDIGGLTFRVLLSWEDGRVPWMGWQREYLRVV